MNYKHLLLIIFLVLNSCAEYIVKEDYKPITSISKSFFLNKGFALVYEESLFNDKIVKDKIDPRSLLIFQKNLKQNSTVKITNLINSKTIIAKVGKKTLLLKLSTVNLGNAMYPVQNPVYETRKFKIFK